MEATVVGLPKALAALLSFVALVTALAGCSPAGSPLKGMQWKLVGWTISSIEPRSVTITAEFAGGQVSGNSGVNSYGGPYKLDPGNSFLTGPLAGTMMAGPEPAMRAEAAYLTLLGQAKSYKMADDKLTLYDEGGNESLIFESIGK